MAADEGFTLIELLIVVAIIAILAAIAIPQYAAYKSQAIRASMLSDSKTSAEAMETLFSDCGTYKSAFGAKTGTGPAAMDLNFVKADCTHNPALVLKVHVSAGNVLEIISADDIAWTSTITNSAGDDLTYQGPIQRSSSGMCTYVGSGQGC